MNEITPRPEIGIIMGSDSDLPVLQEAIATKTVVSGIL
jgi:phosphoribosylcarboxyaminoimidazole (NCAIR) mutase